MYAPPHLSLSALVSTLPCVSVSVSGPTTVVIPKVAAACASRAMLRTSRRIGSSLWAELAPCVDTNVDVHEWVWGDVWVVCVGTCAAVCGVCVCVRMCRSPAA